MVRNVFADRRGSALVEFALALPMLMVLLGGMLAYGQYFLLAHSVQQIANEAARATVAGLTGAERDELARSAVARALVSLPELRPASVSVRVMQHGEMVTTRVALDASGVPLLQLSIVPLPETLIERQAVVRQGGIA